MEWVYRICLAIGLIYTAISLFLGFIHIGFDFHLDFDLPFFSFLSPLGIISFLTIFGGVGMTLTEKNYGGLIVFAVSVSLGLLCNAIVTKLIIKPLRNSENTSTVSRYELIGSKALVITSIINGKVGAISYVVNDNKYTAPAKSLNDEEILRNSEVIIKEIKDSIFYVEILKKEIEKI